MTEERKKLGKMSLTGFLLSFVSPVYLAFPGKPAYACDVLTQELILQCFSRPREWCFRNDL